MAFEYPNWMKDEKQKEAYKKFMEAQKAYETFVVQLSSLGGERNLNNTDVKQGLAAKMTEQELHQLKELSEQIISAGQEMKQVLEKTGQGKKLASKKSRTAEEDEILRGERELELNIRRGNRQANRELSYAENIAPGESVSYASLHRQSTDVVINTGSDELEKVGGYLSDRIPVRYMNEKGELEEGFFTQDYAPEWTVQEIVDRAKFVSPGMAEIVDAIAAKENGLRLLSGMEFNLKADANGIRNAESVPLVLQTLGINDNLYKKDGKDRTFTQAETAALHDLALRFMRMKTMKETHVSAGIEPGSNINQRNTAMSDIATLLGCGKDVAKSIPMTLMVDGKPVRGSFMKKASGLSIDDIEKDLKLHNEPQLEIDYASLGESCANLLITDYICANIDRHLGNIFVNVEPSKDGKKMLVNGVKGIDNDLSFGNLKINEKKAVKFLPALSEIGSIPRATAEKIQKLDKETLAGILVKDGISPDQIDACWDRVTKLQKKIQKNPDDFIVDKYTKERVEKEIKREYKSSNLIEGFGVQTPFKQAGRAAGGLASKIANFATKFRAKANEIFAKLENAFKKEEKDRIPFDSDYEHIKCEIQKLKKAGKAIPEDWAKMAQEKHKEREEIRKQLTKELGYNNTTNRPAMEEKARKLAEKEFKDEYNAEQAVKRRANGVKRLHEKVQIDSIATVKGQAKEIESLLKRFNKLGPDGTDELQALKDEMNSLYSTLSKVAQKKTLNDMDANLIADQFKDVQKAITAYVPVACGPNAAKLCAAAECMDNLCDIAKDSRERQVNELNELMSAAFKELANSNDQVQKIKKDPELGENSAEYKLALAAFDAKQVLAGAVGNLGPMENVQYDINSKAIATLTLVEHINNLKGNNPEAYQSYANMIKEDPKSLDKMADVLVSGKSFDTLVSKANTYKAIVNKPEKYIAAELDKNLKLKYFDEIAAGVRGLDGVILPEKAPKKELSEDKLAQKEIAEEDYVKPKEKEALHI